MRQSFSKMSGYVRATLVQYGRVAPSTGLCWNCSAQIQKKKMLMYAGQSFFYAPGNLQVTPKETLLF